MKKLVILFTLLSSITFSKKIGLDIKVGTSVSLEQYLDTAVYINAFAQKGSHPIYKDYSRVLNLASGTIYAKLLKTIELKNGIEVKVGGGISLNVTSKTSALEDGFKTRIDQYNKGHVQHPSYPTVVNEYQDFNDTKETTYSTHKLLSTLKTLKEKDGISDSNYQTDKESKAGVDKFIRIARKQNVYDLLVFTSLEVDKLIAKDIKVYGAIDLGLTASFIRRYKHTFRYGYTYENAQTYTLKRNLKRLKPDFKAAVGLNYRYLDVEVFTGYPQLIGLNVGARFGL